MKPEKQIKALLKVLSEGIYEKEHILAMALLSAIAGESVFLLGPPGTAKSLVARRLKLAFKDGKAFEYLMSRFSTPDEIFGPVSISLLKNEDRYERVVDGFLPTADIVFLDEIWKASPSIQNALLTAINERIFQNGKTTLPLPMKCLIAASNELPAEDEGLEALWDRFLVRMVSNCIQSETTFYKMIRQKTYDTPQVADGLTITEEMYDSWKRDIDNICIPDEVCSAVSFIRKCLKTESRKDEVNEMDYYVSDRRWKKCFRLLQTSAFLNGRTSVDITDLPILIHCLWNKSETITVVVDIVCRSITSSIDALLDTIEKDMEQALRQKSETVKPEKSTAKGLPDTFSLTDFFFLSIQGYPYGKCLFYKTDYSHISPKNPSDGILYWDEEKKAWIVRAIFTGAAFSYKTATYSNVKKVTLQKCIGGIIIDSIPFSFKKTHGINAEGIFDNQDDRIPNIADLALARLTNDIRPQLAALQNQFVKSGHLFLSDNDLKITKKYISKYEKRVNEVDIKIQNTQKLL